MSARMEKPTVSVIMPVHNGARFLAKSIGSLLNQTYTDLEVIAVDDGSTDDSPRILQRLAAGDARLLIHVRPKSGRPAIPRNDGLRLARGKYIGFLDCDDHSHPDQIRRLVDALETHPAWTAVFHDLEVVDAEGRPNSKTYLQEIDFPSSAKEYIVACESRVYECTARFHEFMILRHAAMHTQSVLIARERLNGLDLSFDTGYRIGEDTLLWLRLARSGRIGYLDWVLGSHRKHAAGITHDKHGLDLATATLYAAYHNEIQATSDRGLLVRLREKIGYKYGRLAYEAYSAGRHRDARSLFREAHKWDENTPYWSERFKTYLPPALSGLIRRLRNQ